MPWKHYNSKAWRYCEWSEIKIKVFLLQFDLTWVEYIDIHVYARPDKMNLALCRGFACNISKIERCGCLYSISRDI